MKPSVLAPILLFSLATASHAAIDVPVEKLKESTIVLGNEEGCGTGFVLSSGNVVTNSHVIFRGCNQKVCSNIEVLRSANLGEAPQRLDYWDFEIVGNFPVSDMVILKPKKPLNINGIEGKISAPVSNEDIFTIGFPNCKNLVVQQGKVTNLNPMNFSINVEVQKGQSGSAVFNKNLEIIGLVYQGGLDSLGRATRVDHLAKNFDLINAENGVSDLINLYKAGIEKVKSADLKEVLSGITLSRLDISKAEAQLALSGQCPALKDYWIWSIADLPRKVPPPTVDGLALSPKCYELFHSSVEFRTYEILTKNSYPLDRLESYKITALKTLSPTAHLAETHYDLQQEALSSESSLIGKVKILTKQYSGIGFPISAFLTGTLALFFFLNFAFSRSQVFRKACVGIFAICALCTLWLWWVKP